jgi:hypothetical protein
MRYDKYLCKALLVGVILAGSAASAWAEEPIATGTHGDRIDLYDERGPTCPEGLKRAVYTYLLPNGLPGQTVEGCWRADSTLVFMAFADGDRGAMELDVFTWRQGHIKHGL